MPTIRATFISYNTTEKLFPKTHHLTGKANAFRHALWNMVICNECVKWKNDIDKAVTWAKITTDWHEEFSPNKALARAMDLHNNEVGRCLFLDLYNGQNKLKSNHLLNYLQEKLNSSVKIKSEDDIKAYPKLLVYITD
ncbi:MAG: hypothetical protein WBM92_07510 [Aureibaculum sp.]